MNRTEVTKDGLTHVRPGREALTGAIEHAGPRRRRGAEQAMVPDAAFTSYYGKPVINKPVWEAPDIPGYLFLGGLAGGSALLAAGAELTGRRRLARRSKVAANAAAVLSTAALVHDLGRPERFLNMLRVMKPTSPMSMGSWVLAPFGGISTVAAVLDLLGRLPLVGKLATFTAAALGLPLASYTAALLADTAVPSWHEGYREMPFVFVASAAASAGGLGIAVAPLHESAPARRMAVAGGLAELALSKVMEKRMGLPGEAYSEGRAHRYMQAAEGLTAAGAVGAVVGRRSRVLSALSGLAVLAGSVCTRWGIFHAGLQSAEDPKYTVVPQRERLRLRGQRQPVRV
ncbi:MAG TPA: NrfD/PsrC family molybdoenzyme membrane anchor subunit [Acidimicrobiales bacterium]|nr:NrfD/PsrC family molybdoenzyme membrane anchor subunit [Acidimicrobiales bacterium]